MGCYNKQQFFCCRVRAAGGQQSNQKAARPASNNIFIMTEKSPWWRERKKRGWFLYCPNKSRSSRMSSCPVGSFRGRFLLRQKSNNRRRCYLAYAIQPFMMILFYSFLHDFHLWFSSSPRKELFKIGVIFSTKQNKTKNSGVKKSFVRRIEKSLGPSGECQCFFTIHRCISICYLDKENNAVCVITTAWWRREFGH